MKNTGTDFESILETQHAAYLAQGRAKIEKVSQPIRVFGPPGRQRVIHLPNPFLDFTGSWIERGGRAIHIECKVTGEPRLSFNSDTGIKPAQLEALIGWEAAGAAVGVLWFHAGRARLLTLPHILAAEHVGRKSVRWASAYDLPQGGDLIFWDYLAAFAALWPCTSSTSA